ncbi:uncharacterized protein [Antedon mediterranea]|uniref:uncharacterized protein n=1 Tax=Antedon mediterranea TaxID=105859 RepID=UPI003AF92EA7
MATIWCLLLSFIFQASCNPITGKEVVSNPQEDPSIYLIYGPAIQCLIDSENAGETCIPAITKATKQIVDGTRYELYLDLNQDYGCTRTADCYVTVWDRHTGQLIDCECPAPSMARRLLDYLLSFQKA